MLWQGSIFVVIGLVCLFRKLVSSFKVTPLREIRIVQGHSGMKLVKFFPVSIPCLDSLYALTIFKIHGMSVIHHYMRCVPLENMYKLDLFGLSSVVVSGDVSFSNTVLNSSNPGHLSRPKMLSDFAFIIRNGLLCTPYSQWIQQRKMVSRAFSVSCVKSYIENVNLHSSGLVRNIMNFIKFNGLESSDPQITAFLKHAIFKLNLEFCIGSSNGIADSEDAMGFLKDILECKQITSYRFVHVECFLPIIWWLHPKRRRAQFLQKRTFNFVAKSVEHYKIMSASRAESKQRCLVDEMMKHGATVEAIHQEIVTFLFAGNDTISTALNFILYHLARHQVYQERCRNEVDCVLGPYSNFENDSDAHLDMEKLSKLEYLERFICECLRITPTVPFIIRELHTSLRINDELTLKKGQIVLVSPWAIHHNPKYYPDPEIFNPDRFLPEEVSKRDAGSYIPFSAGFRNCIGRKLAMLELKILSCWILRNFVLSTDDELYETKLTFEISLQPEKPFQTFFRSRQNL